MAKTPWQYLGRKSHCWKAHFFKICFFVKYFRQRLLSLVNMGLHAAIIRLSPLIHEGEQRYKPYIVGNPRMVSLLWPPFEKSWLRPWTHGLYFLRIRSNWLVSCQWICKLKGRGRSARTGNHYTHLLHSDQYRLFNHPDLVRIPSPDFAWKSQILRPICDIRIGKILILTSVLI